MATNDPSPRVQAALDRLHTVASTAAPESSVSVIACDLQLCLDQFSEGLAAASRRLRMFEQQEKELAELRKQLASAKKPAAKAGKATVDHEKNDEATPNNEPPAAPSEPTPPAGDEPAASS